MNYLKLSTRLIALLNVLLMMRIGVSGHFGMRSINASFDSLSPEGMEPVSHLIEGVQAISNLRPEKKRGNALVDVASQTTQEVGGSIPTLAATRLALASASSPKPGAQADEDK